MRTIESAAIDFAGINEDQSANKAMSYNKFDIENAFIAGAEFGTKNFIEFCEENYSIVIPEFLIKEYFKSV